MAGEIIRPSALPNRPTPVASEKVPVDNGSTVAGATIEALVLAGRPAASQAEAEAGTDPTKAMTPLTTKQAIDEQVPVKIDAAIVALDLGTAAQSNATDFATAAQGVLAGTAVQPARTIATGTGLTGGGSLAANRTLALNAASIASLAKADSAVQTLVQGTNIIVDATDPQNPIISVDPAGSGGPPSGYLYGLTLANSAGDPTNDIDIAIGTAVDDANTQAMDLAAPITKRLDAVWAVGSGNGGLDTGAIANATYHVFLIMRSDTGVVDALFSLSPSSPTMPANYNRKRRIGSIVRASGAILGFVQDGDHFTFKTMPATADYIQADPGTAAISVTLSRVPTGIRARVRGFVTLFATVVSFVSAARVSDLSADDSAPGATANNTVLIQTLPTAGSYRQTGYFEEYCNTSAQVRLRCSATNAALTVYCTALGWLDPRGRL